MDTQQSSSPIPGSKWLSLKNKSLWQSLQSFYHCWMVFIQTLFRCKEGMRRTTQDLCSQYLICTGHLYWLCTGKTCLWVVVSSSHIRRVYKTFFAIFKESTVQTEAHQLESYISIFPWKQQTIKYIQIAEIREWMLNMSLPFNEFSGL